MSDNLKGKKICVTGAAGFIGSHLVERLLYLGAKIKAFVHYNSAYNIGFLKEISSQYKDNLKIVSGDIRELDTMKKTLSDVEIVFHLASIISIPYSYQHPQEVFDTNVIGTLNVLLAAKENGVGKVIHTSTSEVYGSAQYVPMDEKHPKQPQSIYSASKIGADALVLSFYHSYNMPVSICRPFNTYGPRQSDRAVVPVIIAQALKKDEIVLGSVTSRRDFTYVTDTVEGFIKMALSDKVYGKEINLGTGVDYSIEEITYKISDCLGKKIKIRNDDLRMRPEKSEVQRLCSNNTLAKSLLGWEPQVDINVGLKMTVDWIKNNLNHYNPQEYRI